MYHSFFLECFHSYLFGMCKVCDKVQAILGQVSCRDHCKHFPFVLMDFAWSDTTHMSPKRLAPGATPSWHCKRRSILWSFPAACPSWLVGQNSSQQESQNCSKLFPGCYSLLALTFYWWKGDQDEYSLLQHVRFLGIGKGNGNLACSAFYHTWVVISRRWWILVLSSDFRKPSLLHKEMQSIIVFLFSFQSASFGMWNLVRLQNLGFKE